MILALRALGLGDLLTSVPALRALRRARPAEPLALAIPRPLHALATAGGLADVMVDVAPATTRAPEPFAPPEGGVTIAVNLHGEGPQSTELLRHLRPDDLWSYGIAGAPSWRPDEHEVRRWCRLVEHHGCPADPFELALWQRPGPGAGVLIHPGAATAERRWPVERFAAVAGALARTQPVRVSAGPGEEALAASVAAAHPRIEVATNMDVMALARLVASSALVVCGDTGVAHLATALGTPSVVLFGPQPPSRWGPPPTGRHRIFWRPSGEPARPAQVDPALLRVTVAEVVCAAQALLA